MLLKIPDSLVSVLVVLVVLVALLGAVGSVVAEVAEVVVVVEVAAVAVVVAVKSSSFLKRRRCVPALMLQGLFFGGLDIRDKLSYIG